jgi:7-cyano-7-deazaguanine synthase
LASAALWIGETHGGFPEVREIEHVKREAQGPSDVASSTKTGFSSLFLEGSAGAREAPQMNDFDSTWEHQGRRQLDARSFREQRPRRADSKNRRGVGHGTDVVGLLVSGGLDSSILLKRLLDDGRIVKPFYIRSGLYWQVIEQRSLERVLDAVAVRQLEPLTVLDLPLADVYGDHWSITGRNVPQAGAPDEAVYLPGRNALLTIKAAVWCQMHGIEELALATLRSNPFQDASALFFGQLGEALTGMPSTRFRLTRPFGSLNKQEVMELGRTYPLASTFSCIAPRDGAHCGQCNKCAERQAAFRVIGSIDPTHYACAAVRGTSVADHSKKHIQEANP